MLKILSFKEFDLINEAVHPSGSFKWRGAIEQLRSIIETSNVKLPGIVTFSSGNHGLAVAKAAELYGLQCTVVVPVWVDPKKLDALSEASVNVIKQGNSASECEKIAMKYAEETGYKLAHPYRNATQIRGYSNLWTELATAYPLGADILVPIGSGGLLASGIQAISKHRFPLNIIGVESKHSATVSAAMKSGCPIKLQTRSKAAPALNVEYLAPELFNILSQSKNLQLVQISDHEIFTATKEILRLGISMDPAAMISVAAVLYRPLIRHHDTLSIIGTGGVKVDCRHKLKATHQSNIR